MTFPLSNFNGVDVDVWKWLSNFIRHIAFMDLFIHPGIKVDLLVKEAQEDPMHDNAD